MIQDVNGYRKLFWKEVIKVNEGKVELQQMEMEEVEV